MIIWRVEHKHGGYGPFAMFHDFEYHSKIAEWFKSRHTDEFPTPREAGLGIPRPLEFHGVYEPCQLERWFGSVAEELDEFGFVARKYVCSWRYVTTAPGTDQVLFNKEMATAIETLRLPQLLGGMK